MTYVCFKKINCSKPWVGMQCVTVVFPDHSHLLFSSTKPKAPGQLIVWYLSRRPSVRPSVRPSMRPHFQS